MFRLLRVPDNDHLIRPPIGQGRCQRPHHAQQHEFSEHENLWMGGTGPARSGSQRQSDTRAGVPPLSGMVAGFRLKPGLQPVLSSRVQYRLAKVGTLSITRGWSEASLPAWQETPRRQEVLTGAGDESAPACATHRERRVAGPNCQRTFGVRGFITALVCRGAAFPASRSGPLRPGR